VARRASTSPLPDQSRRAASGALLEGSLTGLEVAFALPVVAALLTIAAALTAVRHRRSGVGLLGWQP
jgi:hypothetical protein